VNYPEQHDGLLTREELCEKLQVSPSTVERLRRKGLPVIYVGSSVRYALDRVMSFLDSNSRTGRPSW